MARMPPAPTPPDWHAQIISSILALLPIVTGGLIAMVASLGSGLYQHRLKSLNEARVYKRDKLERFVTIVHLLHHLGLSADTESELEQSRKWVQLVAEMLTITQLHLPELMPAGVMIMNGSMEFAKAGQRVFAASNDPALDPDAFAKLDADYQALRAESQVGWEFALDEAQILARRLGLHGVFKPLSAWPTSDEDEPEKTPQADAEPD